MILQSLLERGPSSKRDGLTSGFANPMRWFLDSLGGQRTAAGTRVNEFTALGLPAVYVCIRVLAESVASVPLHLYRKKGDKKEIAADHPLYRLTYGSPNPFHTSFLWRELMMAHLASWGNSYGKINRKRSGAVAEIWPLHPQSMAVRADGLRKKFTYNPPGGGTVDLDQDEVLHIPGIGYDGLQGWSPIRVHREAIGAGLATQDYSSRFFGNGAQPQGVLTSPGNIVNPDKLKQDWVERNSDEKKLGIAVLPNGMKYEQISIDPDDAQFVETRGLQTVDICRIFRVPPILAMDYGRATWNNSEQAGLQFLTYTMLPWFTRIEAALNSQLLSDTEREKYFFKFKVQGFLRADHTARSAFYGGGIINGWLTRNEVREFEEMDPLDGLDEPLTPVAVAQKAGEGSDPASAADFDADPPGKKKPKAPKEAKDADRQLALAAAERMLTRELVDLRQLLNKHHDHPDWLAGVNDYYREHKKRLARSLSVTDEVASRFLDARWRDLQDPKTVKSTLEQWADEGAAAFLEAVRHA